MLALELLCNSLSGLFQKTRRVLVYVIWVDPHRLVDDDVTVVTEPSPVSFQ